MEVRAGNPYLPSSAGSRGRVLITQFPEDEGVHSTMTRSSDEHSDGGGTLYSHVIDTPIPEENEEEEQLDGRFSQRSKYSAEFLDNMNGQDSQHFYRHSSPDDGVSDSYKRSSDDGEEEKSYLDSMSMDNVSDSFSIAYEPPEMKDEDFDTDLEMDDDKWLHPEKYDHDTTGLTKYLNACEENDVTPISYFIKHMLEETMNLGYHGLGPAAMKALAVPLESNTSIERLDLEGNWIDDEGIHHLCRVLKENVYIVQLNLAENKMGNSGALCVLRLMHENRTIEWLDLSGNNMNDNSGETLGDMLKKNNTLRHLKLRHNELGDPSAQYIKEALADNDSLETLDISWNHFQTRGCVLVAEGLKENVGLREVDISMNGFGQEGATALGEAIKANRTLLKLYASYTRLPEEGAVSLASGLQMNESLQVLDVGYNSLGPEGTLALLLGLERNECSALTELDLGKTKVLSLFKELQDRLEEERPLRVLHGGVMPYALAKEQPFDPMEAFKRDPMTKLKEWMERAGYRLIDVLRHFDRDRTMTLSRKEFVKGIKSVGIEVTDEQIEILLQRLDADNDDEIDFSELIRGDKDHRKLKREILRYEEEQQRMRHEKEESALATFLKNSTISTL